MNTSLLLMLSVFMAPGWPNVRVDHQDQSKYTCGYCAIALGPGAPSSQPVYVAFEGDTLPGGRCDVWFQRSLDGGRTWLPEDRLIRRGDRYAAEPDITTDSDGNVYVEYLDEYIDTLGGRHYHISCVRSSDGGATWTAPARVDDDSSNAAAIGTAQIAADSAGDLLCAWNDNRTTGLHIWSAVSTDRGETWGRNVQVDDDTTDYDCYNPDVSIQPGTNHYLVVAEVPRWFETIPHIRMGAEFYRSTDRGQTFQSGVRLDTFDEYSASPHVVADRDHIICDYLGQGQSTPMLAEARTFYTQPDTWGKPSSIINPDSFHVDDMSAPALSADGRVHTALYQGRHVYYTSSLDDGVSWSDPTQVNEDTLNTAFPDIGADSDGYAYVVWGQGGSAGGCYRIWFATNNPLAIAEQPPQQPIGVPPLATVIRNVLFLAERPSSSPGASCLLDIGGRQVMVLKPGANDVSRLSPGVYFVREAQAQAQAVRKVVVTR